MHRKSWKVTFINVVKPRMPRKGQGLVLTCFSWTMTLRSIVPMGLRTKRVPTAGPVLRFYLWWVSDIFFSSSCYFNTSSLSKKKKKKARHHYCAFGHIFTNPRNKSNQLIDSNSVFFSVLHFKLDFYLT